MGNANERKRRKPLAHVLAYKRLLKARAEGRICEHCGNEVYKKYAEKYARTGEPVLCVDCYVAFKGVHNSVSVDPVAYEQGHVVFTKIVHVQARHLGPERDKDGTRSK